MRILTNLLHCSLPYLGVLLLLLLQIKSSFAQPIVDLGEDTIVCENLILDAGNPGAVYLWSTNEITQTILVNVSGVYWVDVTDATGTTRDSISITVIPTPPTPTLNDTSVCGTGVFSFSASVVSDQVVWYDAPSGGNVIASGNPAQLSINSTSTYYVEAVNFASLDTVGLAADPGMSLAFQSGNKGFIFDVFTPVILKSVAVFADQATSFRIQLEDNGGGILDSVTVSIPGNGNAFPTVVPLDFDLPVGTDFRLIATNITTSGSGLGFTNISSGYPFEVPGIISLTSTNDQFNRVYYFFDWVITQKECRSNRDAITITTLSAPVVDLGPDSIYCDGSVVLDASFPGATYLWSTGETSSSIIVQQNDTIWVESSIGSCAVRDTIVIEFVPTPPTPNLNDTSVCGTGVFSFSASVVSDQVLWYDAPSGGNVIASGNPAQLSINSTSTYYVEAVNFASLDTVGLAADPGMSLAFQSGNKGFIFDVFTPVILKSVAVFADQATSFRIQLEDNGGGILDSVTVSIPGNGNAFPTVVPLDFDLPVGTDFRLIATNITTSGSGLGFTNISSGYPFEVPGIISLTSTNDQFNRVYYFFDWVITQKECRSNRDAITITTLSAPVVDLGPDSIYCDGSVVLDASFPGATYLWSTGETSSSIIVQQNDTIWVESSIGSCAVRDTIVIEFIPTPSTPNLNDTSVCGTGVFSFSASVVSDQLIWYDAPSGGNIIASGNPAQLSINSTSTYYVEAVNFASLDTVGLAADSGMSLAFQSGNKGFIFDVFTPVILKSVAVFADQATSFRIQLEDNGGGILDSVTVSIPGNGNAFPTVVPLDFDLPVGTDFRLIATNITTSGSGLGFTNISSGYPFEVPGIISLTSTNDQFNRVYYFFDWVVTQKECRSNRGAITITSLPTPVVDLGPDTAACGNSYLLVATNPGASYLWSTGETSPTISVTASDTVFVDATVGTCTERDSVVVELVPPPLTLIPNDTNICNVGIHPFTFEHDGDILIWYEDSVSDQILASGDTLYYPTQDTTTLYAESVTFSEFFLAGRSIGNPALAGYQSTIRGAEFTVESSIVLSYVTLYSDAPTDVTILVETQQGQAIDSTRVHVPDMLGKEVPLFFHLAPGSYRIVGKDISGGGLAFFGSGASYPYEVPEIISIDAAGNGTTFGYYYFFDWKVVRQACFSPRKAVTIEIQLPLNLGEEIYSCDDVILDAGNPSAMIVWNTGETTPSITVSQTGKYWVEISDGQGCISSDTVEVIIPELNLGEDGTICGTNLITGYDSTSTIIWNTGDTTSTLALADTGLFWVTVQEPLGCTLTDTIFVTGFADFPEVDLGMDFSSCDSAMLNAGNPGMSYLWSTADTTQTIQIYAAGSYSVEVTNSFGCTTEDEINVFIAPSPTAEFAYQANGATISFENLSSLGSNFWDFGDGNTSNLLSPIHTYSDTGTYTVRLIIVDILNNCGSDTFLLDITISSLTSIDGNFSGGRIEIFPNPTSQQLTVQFQRVQRGDAHILLIDPSGREILHSESSILSEDQAEMISLPDHISSGLYYLVVRMNHDRYVQKIMIQ